MVKKTESNGSQALCEVRLLRLPAVLARMGISRSSWYVGIKNGKYPKGFLLGQRTRVWPSNEVDALIATLRNV